MKAEAALAAVLVAGLPGAHAAEPARSQSLACQMTAVQTGQFQRLDYLSGPAGGAIGLSVIISPADLAAGRGVIIGDERAGVATLVVQPGQTLLIDTGTPDEAASLALFTRGKQGDAVPAFYSRHTMVGHVPLVSQYAGICKPP